MDIGLVLKLQQKLRALESENHRLHSKFDQRGLTSINHRPTDTVLVSHFLYFKNLDRASCFFIGSESRFISTALLITKIFLLIIKLI